MVKMKNKILNETIATLKQDYETKLLAAAEACANGTLLKLETEIEDYSKYLAGEIYEWRVINTISGECLDVCGGFLDYSKAQKDGEAALKSFIE